MPAEVWLDAAEIEGRIERFRNVRISAEATPGRCDRDMRGVPTGMSRQENLAAAIKALEPWFERVSNVFFVMRSEARRRHMDVICQMLRERPAWMESWREFITGDLEVGIGIGSIESGFYLPEQDLVVFTEREIFGQPIYQKDEQHSEAPGSEDEESLLGLAEGDPLVHIRYGVGRFAGLKPMTLGGQTQDFLQIEYAQSVRTFTKMEDLDQVLPYSGTNSEDPPLDDLESKRWIRGVHEAQSEIRQIAEQLISLKAERESASGIAFNEPGNAYERFVNEFPFQETRDQRQAIAAVLEDMQKPTPMDRVVCGDVGFGKTEVAMRAAFLAAESGYQVAVLVPTTLLAQQHLETFRRRFEPFGVEVESMTGIRVGAHSARRLRDGSAQVVIGTHRLLQKDVRFKNLGLVIIDEEHRFGVQQKAKFRELRAELDTLSLTATPIPRTLSLSMHGIRDISIIATPPAKRLSIRTFTGLRNSETIREAVARERMRGGQVFFVHNSVETIDAVAEELRELLPDVRIGVGHGQMPEHELEEVMSGFYRHDFDLLVCTTIVETGIDIPNANTIVIDQAENFGLAQLHQLRGRVGRSHHQAYAYLMTSKAEVSSAARRRLDVLSSATKLGQGFLLATHDLEIRGAGELLGEKQSGRMQSIGFHLYMRLLERTIEALQQGKSLDEEWSLAGSAALEVGVHGIIPAEFIDDPGIRLACYKRLASATSKAAVKRIAEEIADRFGEAPPETRALYALSEVKAQLRNAGVKKALVGDDGGRLEFWSYDHIDLPRLMRLIDERPDELDFSEAGDALILNRAPAADSGRIEYLLAIADALKP
jgi:transcription-repair coupling factor (superfamily II helicase)